MTLYQVLLLALIQGVTELFPVSSLGHGVLVPALLHWSFDERAPFFLPLLTMLHFGTLIAILGVFGKDWIAILRGLCACEGAHRQEESLRILILICIATLPAVFFGGLFEHRLREIFASPRIVAGLLIVNGALLLFLSRMHARSKGCQAVPLAKMSLWQALSIGFWQCLALFPGISRSGITIVGGVKQGLSYELATRFSLLIAQPIILAATVKEMYALRHVPLSGSLIVYSLIACVVAGVTALVCTLLLMRFVRHSGRWAIIPFSIYCVAAGAVSFFLLSFQSA